MGQDMGIIKSFDIRRLKPFHRPGERFPTPIPEKEDTLTELDPDLKPDEQAYVSHYLSYADVLLNEPAAKSAKPPDGKVVKIQDKREKKQSEPLDDNGKVA